MKDNRISIVTHELRTPLTALLGYIELAQMMSVQLPVDGDEPSYQQLALFLHMASEQALLAEAMVKDLYALNGGFVIQPIRCDVGELVRATVTARVQERQILLQGSIAEGAIALADPMRVSQVLANYLSNACKYAGSGPITVSVEMLEDVVRVVVCDKGPGISLKQQRNLWKKGYRVANRPTFRPFMPRHHKPIREGLGLGLFISKMLIEQQGGHVGVESELGKGASFWFTLPRATRL